MRLPLFPSANCPALHEPGPTPLREADVDDIEVLRHDRLREDAACLAHDLGPEVAIGEVGQRQQPHACCDGKLGRARRSGVQRLVGSLALLNRERRLVDEHVGTAPRLEYRDRSSGVARENDFPAGPRRAENVLRKD
jgi:hypothetical protein